MLQKWGEYSGDVQFILQRSALDPGNKPPPSQTGNNAPLSPQPQRTGKFLSQNPGQKAQSAEPPAVWKPPPNPYASAQSGPNGPIKSAAAARLSPDSGRGSDKTGSDSSYHENSNGVVRPSHTTNGSVPPQGASLMPRSASASQMPYNQQHATSNPGSSSDYGFSKQQSMPALRPPAYRPPPGPAAGSVTQNRNSSPADPPPYRDPPPPESRYGTTTASGRGGQQTHTVRPPHYSPPPTHRTPHLSRHPSRTSLVQQQFHQQHQQQQQLQQQYQLGGRPGGYGGQPQPHGLPYRQPPTQQQMQQPQQHHYKSNFSVSEVNAIYCKLRFFSLSRDAFCPGALDQF